MQEAVAALGVRSRRYIQATHHLGTRDEALLSQTPHQNNPRWIALVQGRQLEYLSGTMRHKRWDIRPCLESHKAALPILH